MTRRSRSVTTTRSSLPESATGAGVDDARSGESPAACGDPDAGAGTGRPKSQPWAVSQPMDTSCWAWSSSSMPSAQTRSPSVCAASITSCTSTASCASVATRRISERSILTVWSGRLRSSVSEEWPVPKSSRANWTPRSQTRRSTAAASATSVTIAVSVTSRQSRSGASPLSPSAIFTSSTNIGSRSWTGETLTETTRSSDHAAACRQARSSTQRPRSTISPVDSASGMNSSGGTAPSSASCQRASASTPTIDPFERSTTGW